MVKWCLADDLRLIAEAQDTPRTLLNTFVFRAKKNNITIFTKKTKIMVTFKESVNCNFRVAECVLKYVKDVIL